MSEVKAVYAAIVGVMADLGHEGISKDRKNAQQGYNFRGIDDVLNALSGILPKHSLVVLPRVISRLEEERETKSGGRMAYVTVDVEFDLVCATDGSCHTVRTYGEAMDSADKATNKAMSAAYKYAAIMAFCIPTEGDNDTETGTPEVKTRSEQAPKVPAPVASNINYLTLDRPITAAEDTQAVAYIEVLQNNGLNRELFLDLKKAAEKYDWRFIVLAAAQKKITDPVTVIRLADPNYQPKVAA